MRKIILMVTVMLLSFGLKIVIAENTPAPYLYYYSRMLGGLIIERADGTDSRLIGADVIPAGETGISGPGWSPSGRYFAGYPVIFGSYDVAAGAPFVIDVKQKWDIPWPQNDFSTYNMQWSPDRDLLLIILWPAGIPGGIDNYSFWIVDAVAKKVVASFDMSLRLLVYSLGDIVWERDQEQLVFYVTSEAFVSQKYFRITMHFDGTVVKQPISENEFQEHYTPPTGEDDDSYLRQRVSPSGRYRIFGSGLMYLRDTSTLVDSRLPQHSQSTGCAAFQWSPDEQFLITMNGTLVAGGGCSGAVLGVTDSHGKLWRELGGCTWDTQSCVNWLPPQVDVSQLPPGQSRPIQLDPAAYESSDVMFGIMDYGNPVLNLQCVEGSKRHIVDTNAAKILYTLDDPDGCSYDLDSFADVGVPILTAYDPSHQLLATYQDYSGGYVSIWKICPDGIGTRILKLNTYGYELEFTPDGQELRARNVNAWKIYDVDAILASATADCETATS